MRHDTGSRQDAAAACLPAAHNDDKPAAFSTLGLLNHNSHLASFFHTPVIAISIQRRVGGGGVDYTLEHTIHNAN